MEHHHGPTYVSNRNAEGILSDIRPIKFSSDGLKSTNVFLDELLYSVLAASRSLVTSEIKIGLLKVLPTPLGKEAVLEAEMELRSYIDRTGSPPTASDVADFHLQWSFETLRLKCEAYSTLSDSDEDAQAEVHLNERMSRSVKNLSAPKPSLVAPAALYLTAVIESICEHVLVNVGRVAARDSSRSSATVADLFTALCEDDSIFGFFRTMKVYEKIESLALLPRPRRSKSFTKTIVGNDSPNHSVNTSVSNGFRSRNSSESHTPIVAQATRASIEKARGLKMFKGNGKTPSESGDYGHKRNVSAASEAGRGDNGRGSIAASDYGDSDFEDMMRSGSTMKMSLTPDRLRTMESIKDKSLRGKRSLSKASIKASGRSMDSVPPTPEVPRQTKTDRPTQLILEDEEETSYSRLGYGARPRPVSPPPTAMQSARVRSMSGAGGSTTTYVSPNSSISRKRSASAVNAALSPVRSQRLQKNDEEFDFDEGKGVSDQERNVYRQTAVRAGTADSVSANTKDLMEFLATAPPDEQRSDIPRSGSGASIGSNKSTSRLGRLLSKLAIKKSSEKLSNRYSAGVESTTPPRRTSPSNMGPPPSSYAPVEGAPNYVKSMTPRSGIQPSSPAPSHTSFEVRDSPYTQKTHDRYATPGLQSNEASNNSANVVVPRFPYTSGPPSQREIEHSNLPEAPTSKANNGEFSKREALIADGTISNDRLPDPMRQKASRSSKQRTAEPEFKSPPKYFEYAADLRKHMHRATTVDECRLLVDIFLAKSGVRHVPVRTDSLEAKTPVIESKTAEHSEVEVAMVELLLGGHTNNAIAQASQTADPLDMNGSSNVTTDDVELLQHVAEPSGHANSDDAPSQFEHSTLPTQLLVAAI